MKTWLFIILSLMVSSIESQSILGKVIESVDQSLEFANAVLYSKQGVFIGGETTDSNGKFIFNNIRLGEYYIEVSMLGFETKVSDTFEIKDQNNIEITILLEPSSEILNTIVVEGKKPLMEQRADKMIINVEDNLTSLNSSVMDVMKKVPGMMVVNDQLKMAGQPNVTILIDGKSTQYMDMSALLRDMPGDNIKKIEIIQQPGAEYEASGSGAIINIILKKNVFLGTNGSFYAGVGKSFDYFYNTGFNISSYQKKLNIQAGGGYSHSAYYDELQILRRVNGGTYSQLTKDPIDPKSYRANLTLDYDLTPNQRIGVQAKYIYSTTNKIAKNNTVVDNGFVQKFTLNTNNTADRNWNLYTINPYYKYDIDTNGQKLELDFNYVSYGRDNQNVLASINVTENVALDKQQYNQIGTSEVISAKADYTFPITKSLDFMTGVNYSNADLDNNLLAFNEVNGNLIKNLSQSNHFLFMEDIRALYTKVEFEHAAWNGSAGLRYEQSLSKGYSITQDTTLTRDIKKLFPSFSLGRKITKQLGLNFAYSYRIDRPSYSTLNPFVYYYDPYTFEQGNPNLRPELTHSMKLSLAYEGQPFFNVEYKATDDAMVEVTEQNDATGETSRLTVNLATNTNLNTSLFFPLDFVPGVSGYAGAIVNYREIKSQYLNQPFDRSLWSITNVMEVNFKLPLDIDVQISGWHNSGSLEGIINSSWLYGVSFGLSKKVLKDKGTISLGMEDAFNRFWHGSIKYANMDADLVSRWQAKVVNARFAYSFGNKNLKIKSRNNSSASDQIDRMDTN